MTERQRLIINAKGEEKIIYPRPPISETPPEQIIAFPDKKETHVDWRLNLNKLSEISKLIEANEIVQRVGFEPTKEIRWFYRLVRLTAPPPLERELHY